MNVPILQILSANRRLFLCVMCLTFAALAVGIFVLPRPRAIVRMSIEIGFINQTLQPLEPPEEVAKRISGIYVPMTLLAVAEKGTPSSVLAALQNTSVENVGRSLIVVTAINANAENDAKDFQEAIADQVIKEETSHAQLLHEEIGNQISSSRQATDNLNLQIRAIAKALERIRTLSGALRDQIESQKENIAALRQRAGTAQQPTERSAIEDGIRKLDELVSNHLTLLGALEIEQSRLMHDLTTASRANEIQTQLLADAQLKQQTFTETQVLLAPSLMPAPGSYRRVNMLFAAIPISVLVAFGSVLLLNNFVEQKTAHNRHTLV